MYGLRMTFSREDISKLAGLSRLALTEQELEARQKDLIQVLDYIRVLEGVDVSDVEPMTHAVPTELHLRKDEVKPGLGREALKESVGYEDGLIKVPKIIE